MTTTITTKGGHIVRIHDPAETPEAKARQRERIEKAVVAFWKGIERGQL